MKNFIENKFNAALKKSCHKKALKKLKAAILMPSIQWTAATEEPL